MAALLLGWSKDFRSLLICNQAGAGCVKCITWIGPGVAGEFRQAASIRSMFALRRHLRPLTWISLVAILALAMLPTLSHALSHAASEGPGGWAEVCTQSGPKRIAVDAGGRLMDTLIETDANAAHGGAAHLQHCPLCALSLDAPVLPPAASAALPLALASDAPPLAFLYAPRTLHAWRSAQPRGPPAAS
jgi:hypothetical protein